MIFADFLYLNPTRKRMGTMMINSGGRCAHRENENERGIVLTPLLKSSKERVLEYSPSALRWKSSRVSFVFKWTSPNVLGAGGTRFWIWMSLGPTIHSGIGRAPSPSQLPDSVPAPCAQWHYR